MKNGRSSRQRLLVSTFCFLFIAHSVAAAQSQAGLRIQIVQGDRARNILEQVPPNPIIVRITDRENRPVAGATVEFTTPVAGPSGDFDGLNSFRTISDESGLAVVREYHPNRIEGPYQMRVQAEYLGEVAVATIQQMNVEGKRSRVKIIAIVAVAGAVGAAGAALAGRSGAGSARPSSPSNPAPLGPTVPTISFSGSTVTGPK
ncbi:MAG: hypothetical protein DMG14_31130 [Acidobacteria bacterium]|nr:MAG: hypothetical protein DMG14_31130 [Acidobacteriota bacterium]